MCPECNNLYVKKSVAKITLNFLDVSMECEQGHKWTEHFSLTYDGYTNKDNQRLNRFDEIDKEEEQSNDEVQGSKP